MQIYMHGAVIIMGVIFELSGAIALALNYFNKKYDESGFGIGPNDNKVINGFKTSIIGKYVAWLFVIGVFLQLSTILYRDFIIISKPNWINITILLAGLLLLAVGINILFYRKVKDEVQRAIKVFITDKIYRINNDVPKSAKISIHDGIRYMNYLSINDYQFTTIEDLKINLMALSGLQDLENITFYVDGDKA